MLPFPLKRSAFHPEFLRLPDGNEEYFFLFDVLSAAPAPGPNPAYAAQMLARNRVPFDYATDVGGYRYPIGSLEFDKRDWKRHDGSSFRR